MAYKLTQKSISPKQAKIPDRPIVLIIDDDNSKSGKIFIKEIKKYHPEIKNIYMDNNYRGNIKKLLNFLSNKTLVALIFSKVSAWKGRNGISKKLASVLKKAVKTSDYSLIVGFCCPYMLHGLKADTVIKAFSGTELSERAAAEIFYP